MKCKLKNNSATFVTLRMASTAYGLQDRKNWELWEAMVSGFSGRHELYTYPRIGIAERGTYTFTPGEELDTVFILGFRQKGDTSSLNLDICMKVRIFICIPSSYQMPLRETNFQL